MLRIKCKEDTGTNRAYVIQTWTAFPIMIFLSFVILFRSCTYFSDMKTDLTSVILVKWFGSFSLMPNDSDLALRSR